MTKKQIFKSYKHIPSRGKCDNCNQVCEYVLIVGPPFKPYDICEYCFLKDTFTLQNIRDLLNLLRFSTQERLDENINRLINMIDKETRRTNE